MSVCQACTMVFRGVSVCMAGTVMRPRLMTELGRLSCTGCVPEIRSLALHEGPGRDQLLALQRLLGRDQVSDSHGCVLEARRLICTVACLSAGARRLIRTVAWPRSGDWFARVLARGARETDPHDCVAEISCWPNCTVTWPRSGACVARLLGPRS